MADTTIPTLSFQNELAYDIIVYDSFGDDETDSDDNSDDNYFGTLTSLGTVAANTTTVIQPIHKTSAFIIENASTSKPVKRCTKLGTQKNITSFTVNQADEDTMTAAFSFIDFYLKTPDDPMSVAFTAILNEDADSWYSDMTDFFPKYPAYANITFPDYMMAITYNALNPPPPPTPSQPDPPPTYSLRKLAISLGAKWPDGLPDISISKFSCTNKNSSIFITADVDITGFCFESEAIANNVVTVMGGDKHFTVTIQFNYAFGLGMFGTRLSILPDSFTIPVGDSNAIDVTKPAITFDINPLFKFVVFTVKGTIPFDINSKQFGAQISLAVDNDEASVGVSIEGDNSSFPPPPGLKGLFFDEFGVGIGIFFEPLSCIIGIEGKFHIGTPANGTVISLDDDTFALICKITGEAITPAFASFYIPKLDLTTVIELFTNASINLDVPVSFEELSFRWVDSMMSAYVLPDGTLTPGGYGFSAVCNVGSFGFYGDVELNLNNGLTANVEVSPINWKNVFTLTGDGKGFSIKQDANGNPIKNNFIPSTQAEKDAVANATNKQIVSPGGANLIINTLSMPILHLNAKASLFDLLDYDITADINKSGISFELDYGAILTEQMVCNLSDFHNFYGQFGYYIDKSIPMPTIGGISLGSIPLKADASLHLSISTSTTDVVISTGGQFDFEGYHFSFGDFTADINISKIADFVGAIVQYIIDEAKTIFSQIIDTAEHWAAAAGKGIITGFDDAGKVMKNVFNKSEQDMVTILKGAGFVANDIANGLKNGYNAASQDVAALLKQAGYDATTIGNAIKNAWNCGIDDVSWALHEVGFGATDVANAIKNGFKAGAQDVVNTLKKWGYAADDVANVIKNIFGGDSIAVASIMKAAGYAIDDISKGIKDAWNCATTDVTYALKAVGYTADQIAVSLKNVFNAASQDVAAALKAMGFTAEEVAGAIKNCWNCAISDVSWAMNYVGYAVDDIASGLKSAFNASGQDVAAALKAMNHVVNDIAQALHDVYNAASQDIASILKNLGYAAADVAGAIKHVWNCTVNDVTWAMNEVGFVATDISGGLKSAFNAAAQDVANAFKTFGITAQDAANALKTVYNLAINDTASVLKQAGYAANDVASALKNAFNTSVDAVADAMKQVGYAADDVKNAFDELGGDFKSFADKAWSDTTYYLNPSHW